MINPPPRRTPEEEAVRLGLICGVAAYAMWGLFPIYLKSLDGASAFEILAHRIIWSAPFGAIILFMRRQWLEVFSALRSPRVLLMLALSSIAIAANWGIYVWAVVSDKILQASLGYYITPLTYVAAGVFILGEKLRPAQVAAVVLAAIGVSVLTLGAGQFPWAAIALAILFTAYGYIRKTTPVGAMPGLFIETAILSPAALIYLVWLVSAGTAAFTTQGLGMDALLVFAGPVTVIPLVFFALAARRLRLSTIGFLQYIGPTGQFALGLYYGEAFTLAHAFCFAFIWAALILFSWDAANASRAERLAQSAPPITPTASASPKSS
ncbi:MAG: EamA family transporter RarD [Parvularculaceae bacterium]